LKLESLLWYVSLSVIVGISLYVFAGYFGGSISGFDALAVLLVTYAAFGFLIGISIHLGEQRKGGWDPKKEERNLMAHTGDTRRRESSILDDFHPGRPEYGVFKKISIVIVAAGFLLMIESAALGLILICAAAVIYLVLSMIETFEEPLEE
jgi:hypothetical protein